MPNNENSDFEKLSEVVAFSGAAPTPIGAGVTNESYTSYDGTIIYVQFTDVDSNGLYPSTGTHLRFTVSKDINGNITNVTPVSTFIDSALPKVLQLRLNADRKSTRLNSSHIPLSRMPSSA